MSNFNQFVENYDFAATLIRDIETSFPTVDVDIVIKDDVYVSITLTSTTTSKVLHGEAENGNITVNDFSDGAVNMTFDEGKMEAKHFVFHAMAILFSEDIDLPIF